MSQVLHVEDLVDGQSFGRFNQIVSPRRSIAGVRGTEA
jgi:hypothetical protein